MYQSHDPGFFGISYCILKKGIYHYALDFTIRVFFINILYLVFPFDSCNTSLVHSRTFLIDRIMSNMMPLELNSDVTNMSSCLRYFTGTCCAMIFISIHMVRCALIMKVVL